MSDLATCRICGCTEDRACDNGCFWVEDPENLGDLCSKCLPKLAAGPPDLGDNHVWQISLDQIRPAPWNPPSRMDPVRVRELADSIKVEGQQSPALIRPVEAEPPIRYELVWLTEAEKVQISADAAATSRKMQTEKDHIEEMKLRPDSERYLDLLQLKARGGELTSDDRLFMRYFRAGEEYAALKDWFEGQDWQMVIRAGTGR